MHTTATTHAIHLTAADARDLRRALGPLCADVVLEQYTDARGRDVLQRLRGALAEIVAADDRAADLRSAAYTAVGRGRGL